jgi:ABC-type Fe3+/spermidine/putrescine transport system ATPase subunit
LCRQLKQVQQATGTTTVHVCHNFAEMMTVADRVGVIHQGEIVQVGTPEEVLRRPRNTFVARFVQAGNLLDAEAKVDGEWLRLVCHGGTEFRTHRQPAVLERPNVRFVVRPESLRLEAERPTDMPEGTTFVHGRISQVTHLGPVVQIAVSCDEGVGLLASLGKREYDTCAWKVDHHVHVAVAPQDVHVLED